MEEFDIPIKEYLEWLESCNQCVLNPYCSYHSSRTGNWIPDPLCSCLSKEDLAGTVNEFLHKRYYAEEREYLIDCLKKEKDKTGVLDFRSMDNLELRNILNKLRMAKEMMK